MEKRHVVTGASGHLGTHLVRALVSRNQTVRACTRTPEDRTRLSALGADVAIVDARDREGMVQALEGAHVLIHAAAVFRHWAVHPVREIVVPTLESTRRTLEAAVQAGVRRVVYVSSVVALDRTAIPLRGDTWNTDTTNPYLHAKTVAERLAHEMAEETGLDLVSVLPSAMVGPSSSPRLTPTMAHLRSLLRGEMAVDMNTAMNFVDVRDVAQGTVDAADRGQPGQRYILGTDHPIPIEGLVQLAREIRPDLPAPRKVSKEELLAMAAASEAAGRSAAEPPRLTTHNVHLYWGASMTLDLAPARHDLQFSPRSPEDALRDAFRHLHAL